MGHIAFNPVLRHQIGEIRLLHIIVPQADGQSQKLRTAQTQIFRRGIRLLFADPRDCAVESHKPAGGMQLGKYAFLDSGRERFPALHQCDLKPDHILKLFAAAVQMVQGSAPGDGEDAVKYQHGDTYSDIDVNNYLDGLAHGITSRQMIGKG